jgi:hypothetical protein
MYNEHIYTAQYPFLYFFYTSGQAGWPQTFMTGTGMIRGEVKELQNVISDEITGHRSRTVRR